MNIRHKIFSSYIILVAVIGGMTAILLFNRTKLLDIEKEGNKVRFLQQQIYIAHRQITTLAMMGETVMAWDSTDYEAYHKKRLETDLQLLNLRQYCTDFVLPVQVDSLRRLLSDKESHLHRIMETIERQELADSILANQLPEVARRATRIRTVRQKKSGIAGVFGGKKTVQVLPSAKELYALSDSLVAMLQERVNEMTAYSDSLQSYNRQLNMKLNTLIYNLDRQAQEAFRLREKKMIETEKLSFRLIAGVVGTAIFLLLISHFVIVRDLRRRERGRKKLEGALEENWVLSDVRKKIIVTLSHDIRGPLNAISGSAELAMDTRDRKRRNAYLGNILDSSRHIARLANSLLDLSRLDEAKETLNPVPFRLDALLERLAEEHARPANDKGLLFKPEIHCTGITVLGDADRIEQVLGNLLDNAVKFTESGSVTFAARHENGTLEARVADTGIGMDEKTVQRIFRPFERAAPDMDSEGFGLGLSITKGLVGLMGGVISVSSRVGEGSAFEVRIPLPETDGTAVENAAPAGENLRLPKHVLAVDDDPIQLHITREMLERSGIPCRACTDARKVVSELRKGKYDLLLADIQMRGTSGFDLLRLLRHSNIGDSRTIPVVAMTARNDMDDAKYREAGFSACIRKPFSMNELLAVLSSVLPPGEDVREGTADFEALAAEAGDTRWMLETFIEESRKDAADLEEALKHGDADTAKMRETLHRMYPTWEQLGIAHELEAYHKALHGGKSDEGTIRSCTECVIKRLHDLASEAEALLPKTREGEERQDDNPTPS